MSIEQIVLDEAARHISQYGFVKNMEPMALHILKKSQDPTVRAFRGWMRRTAVMQFLEAEREQKKMNDEFAHTQYKRGGTFRRKAVIHPYFATKAKKDGRMWGDAKWVGQIKRDNPYCFPQREAV